MKKAWGIGLGTGMIIGLAAGFSIHPPDSPDPEPAALPASVPVPAAESAAPSPARSKEQELLLLAIEELDLTTAELEDARSRILRMERKARRYDWLRDNGLHGDYSMSFSKDTFEPQQKLIDFLGLDEAETAAFKQLCADTHDAVAAWELEHAVCTEDSSTNCTYEIDLLPDAFRSTYVAGLSALLHEEDVQLLTPAIEDMFSDYDNRQVVSATLIPADAYQEYLQKRGHKMEHWEPRDMIKIQVQRLDENGNKRGSSSSTFSTNPVHLEHNQMYKRWNHLFDFGALNE
ncbi:hypothetical protein [Pontiella sp.]|uniref:hypothetical protein n=1 Tax=Pontiella sp. TaxID=2837462 RepID=UPI0035654A01